MQQMQRMIYEDVTHLLLYFPVDTTFLIYSKEDIVNWSEEIYSKLHDSSSAKVKVDTEYDAKVYSAVVVQCGRQMDVLKQTMEYVIRLKSQKKYAIEKILAMVPRLVTGDQRVRYASIKVLFH
jgi:hypothetical protein